MSVRIVTIGTALVVPLLIVLAFGFGQDPRAVPFVLKDQPLPTKSLETLDGGTFLFDETVDRPTIVNFWATWCQPCLAEHGILQRMAQTYGNVRFLGVVYQDEEENMQSFLQKYGSAYPHAMDPGSRIAIDFGVSGVPETYFVDASGVVRFKHAGMITPELVSTWLEGTP